MRTDDISQLITLSTPTLAPDASFAIFASSRPDLEADRNAGRLWRLDLPDGSPRPLTRGISDRAPQLSPSADVLAFLREDDAGHPQLHLLDPRGGEPIAITDAPLGAGAFTWSPDGTHIAYLARVPEAGRYGTDASVSPAAEPPRRITGLRWQMNGLGYTNDRPAHVFLVAVPSLDADPISSELPETAQLTSGLLSHSALSFAADGGSVLVARENDPADAGLLHTLVRAGLDGGIEELLVPSDGFRVHATGSFSDGTAALLASRPAAGIDSVAPDVALYALGHAGPERLTDPDLTELDGSAIVTAPDGVLLLALGHGRTHVVRVSPDGTIAPVITGDVDVHGVAAARTPDGPLVLASSATPTSYGEILAATPATEPDRPLTLTRFGTGLQRSGLTAPREVTVTGRDGYPIHGWLAVPEGTGTVPVILMIHGGPYASYTVAAFDEVQTLVAAGYAVVYCNPRGSAGYGRAHGRAIIGHMGTADHMDVIDFLDAALESEPRLDRTRQGIMGGSYGGYLTAWVIAHEARFAAAIVERGFLDPESFLGTSDIGWYFVDEYLGSADDAGRPRVSAEDVERQSPYAHVDDVTTPTLVIHSEQDLRCPLEQGKRYYTALARRGVEAELLVFPGENHELSRSGRPTHRLARLHSVLDWWDRHLRSKA